MERKTGPVGGISEVCTARRMASGRSAGPLDFRRPFRPRSGDPHHVGPEDRLLEFEPAVLLTGGQNQRRSGAVGVIQHAHRVAQTAADVDIHYAGRSRGLREAVGHRHDGNFLQAQDVLDPRIVDQRVGKWQLGRSRIAEEILHAGFRQEMKHGVASAHRHVITTFRRQSEAFVPARPAGNPVRPRQRNAGHGGRLDREGHQVFRLEMVHVRLAAGTGERRQLHREDIEVVPQPPRTLSGASRCSSSGSCVVIPTGQRPV